MADDPEIPPYASLYSTQDRNSETVALGPSLPASFPGKAI